MLLSLSFLKGRRANATFLKYFLRPLLIRTERSPTVYLLLKDRTIANCVYLFYIAKFVLSVSFISLRAGLSLFFNVPLPLLQGQDHRHVLKTFSLLSLRTGISPFLLLFLPLLRDRAIAWFPFSFPSLGTGLSPIVFTFRSSP